MMSSAQSSLFSTVPKHNYLDISDAPEDLRHVSEFLRFKKSELAGAINKPQKSIRYDERIPREVRERILEIGLILNLVAEFFEGDLEKTSQWFITPNPLLGELSPRDMIRAGLYKKLHGFIQDAISGNLP